MPPFGTRLRNLIGRGIRSTSESIAAPRDRLFTGPTRYVADARARFASLRSAAQDYPDQVSAETGLAWMRRKPYDPATGHAQFFACMYAAINTVQAMRLPARALIVEVGSGPGWLTQILVGLGYRVIAVEPSSTMNQLARERVAGFSAMTGVPCDETVFVTATLEEADLAAHEGKVNAVMFHEALHHVIDEAASMRQVFGLLRPGGCIAVCGEGRWNPGDTVLEAGLDEEMRHYGTLESPFTQDYLRHVLQETGFADIVFHHSVNGLFPESAEAMSLGEVANPSSRAANTVLAWKPLAEGCGHVPAVTGDQAATAAEIRVDHAAWEDDTLVVGVTLRNAGRTYWPVHEPPTSGGVTLALTEDGSQTDVADRYPLPRMLLPGQEITIDWRFRAPGHRGKPCRLRLVAEDAFWFTDSAGIDV